MMQGLAQTLLVRLPHAHNMGIQPNAGLTYIGLAALAGIVLNAWLYIRMNGKRS